MSVESNLRRERKFVPAQWPSDGFNNNDLTEDRLEAIKKFIDLD